MKKYLVIGLVLLLVLISGCNKYNKFEDWKNNTLPEFGIYFEHPYIQCIFDKTCNGSVYIAPYFNPNNLSNEEIKKIINKYGKYGEVNDYYSDYIVVNDFDNLSKIINLVFINSTFTYINRIESDYKINDSEIKKCNIDYDCTLTAWSCCTKCIPINKNYTGFFGNYRALAFLGTGGACFYDFTENYYDSKCINNSCEIILNKNTYCSSFERFNYCINPENKENFMDSLCKDFEDSCKGVPTDYQSGILRYQYQTYLGLNLPDGNFSEACNGECFWGKNGLIIDKKILDDLINWRSVLVDIVFKEGVDINVQIEIINSLKPSEFMLSEGSSTEGNITRLGLSNLIQNPNIIGIRISEPLSW